MLLLPRSCRGTWLLAGAVWLAACAGLWWALPVVPRGVLVLPEDTNLLCLGPDGTTAIVLRYAPSETWQGMHLDLVEVPSGKILKTIIDRTHLEFNCVSNDRLTLILNQRSETMSRLLRVDLKTTTVTPLAIRETDYFYASDGVRLSPDGRHLAVCTYDEPVGIRIYDVVENRLRGTIVGVRPTLDFSADGQFLVAQVDINGTAADEVAIVDLESLEVSATFAPPNHGALRRASLSNTGRHLVAVFDDGTISDKLVCWDVASRRIESDVSDWTASDGSPQPARVLVTGEWFGDGSTPQCVDLDRPLPIAFVPFNLSDDPSRRLRFSPRRKFAIFALPDPPSSIIRTIADRLGLTSFVRSDQQGNAEIYDLESSRRIGSISVNGLFALMGNSTVFPEIEAHWDGTERVLAVCDRNLLTDSVWHIWDIPPRKPLPWFAAGAALLALPIAFLAWRRTRKLRAA